MPPAVVIKELEWKYEHATEYALKGINLEIQANSFLGVVGANEHSKTSLISAISGLIPHSYNGVYRGSVKVFGHEVRELDALELATHVGFVFADPEAQFTAMTVEEELVFGLENMGLDIRAMRERLAWACDVTMIGDLLGKSPYDVSGGQKQRVAIACVLAMNPPIIIMDEPTSMIDPLGKQFIFDILRKLKNAGEHTLIVVEHNIEQLAPLSDLMLLMQEGKVAKIAPPNVFFDDPEYLVEHGISPPEVTLFAQRLRNDGLLPADTAMPLHLADGVALTKQALANGRLKQ